MDYGISGKTVFISASSKGIGRAAAVQFLKEGCNTAISSSNSDNLEKAVKDIHSITGLEPFPVKCDINKPNEIEKAVQKTIDKFGSIDILINNCGGPAPGYFEEMTDDQWQYGFEQVLMSAVRFTRNVLPLMKNNKWGRIINITSMSVKQPIANLILSNVFRSGLTAMAKTISNEYGKFNITVNNVAPGYTLTERLEGMADVMAQEANSSVNHIIKIMNESVPIGRIGSPEETAAMIVFLASIQAGYITGQTIPVDGGKINSTY